MGSQYDGRQSMLHNPIHADLTSPVLVLIILFCVAGKVRHMLQRQIPGESSVLQPMHHCSAHLLLAYSAGSPPRSTGKLLRLQQ